MVGVDHIHVRKVGGRCLVRQIDRMLERQIPDRECLELGVACLDAPLVFMVKLGQAGCHLAAAGTRCGDHDQ